MASANFLEIDFMFYNCFYCLLILSFRKQLNAFAGLMKHKCGYISLNISNISRLLRSNAILVYHRNRYYGLCSTALMRQKPVVLMDRWFIGFIPRIQEHEELFLTEPNCYCELALGQASRNAGFRRKIIILAEDFEWTLRAVHNLLNAESASSNVQEHLF